MTLQIRPVQDSDYHWLLKLHHKVYRELITQEFGYWDEAEELALFMEAWETKPIEIILFREQPAGMFIVDQQSECLWLDEIQIAPEFQNQGIGTEIIKQVIGRAKDMNLPLRLRVLHANQGAYRLYQRLGFLRIEEAKHHHFMEMGMNG